MTSGGRGGLRLPAGQAHWTPVDSVIPLYDGQRPQQRVALMNKRFIAERPNRSASPGRSASFND